MILPTILSYTSIVIIATTTLISRQITLCSAMMPNTNTDTNNNNNNLNYNINKNIPIDAERGILVGSANCRGKIHNADRIYRTVSYGVNALKDRLTMAPQPLSNDLFRFVPRSGDKNVPFEGPFYFYPIVTYRPDPNYYKQDLVVITEDGRLAKIITQIVMDGIPNSPFQQRYEDCILTPTSKAMLAIICGTSCSRSRSHDSSRSHSLSRSSSLSSSRSRSRSRSQTRSRSRSYSASRSGDAY